jgi:hypothetical protein
MVAVKFFGDTAHDGIDPSQSDFGPPIGARSPDAGARCRTRSPIDLKPDRAAYCRSAEKSRRAGVRPRGGSLSMAEPAIAPAAPSPTPAPAPAPAPAPVSRTPATPAKLSETDFAKLSVTERLAYARQFPQPTCHARLLCEPPGKGTGRISSGHRRLLRCLGRNPPRSVTTLPLVIDVPSFGLTWPPH